MIDVELNVFVANLKTFTFKRILDAKTFPTLRPLDKIVRICHVNSSTKKMVLSLADSQHLLLVDLVKASLEWNLPFMQECGIPLSVTSDFDKVVVAYDSNKIAVFDSLNLKLHAWTKENLNKMPKNFLDRYNRIVGLVPVSDSKFVIWTNYTYCLLDLNASVPSEVEIVQNHPGKSIEGKQFNAQGWFDNLKLSQAKYLHNTEQLQPY